MSTIREKVQAFRTSSAFSAGDSFSFSVLLNDELKLPGKYDPASYLEKLATPLSGKRVCIVCPGNAGLCVEAIKSGASSVSTFEPRTIYQTSLKTVATFVSEALGKNLDTLRALDKPGVFDVIIWSEGVEEIQDPKTLIDSIIHSLAPGGTLIIELSHGTAGPVPDRTNSWRPSKDGFSGTIKSYPQLKISNEIDGRNQVRKIYTVRDTRSPVPVEFFIPQRPIEAPPAPQPEIDLLKTSQEVEDIEYFRKNLFSALSKMRDSPLAQPEVSELSEVFDRPAEPETNKGSTPKSKRKSSKGPKS